MSEHKICVPVGHVRIFPLSSDIGLAVEAKDIGDHRKNFDISKSVTPTIGGESANPGRIAEFVRRSAEIQVDLTLDRDDHYRVLAANFVRQCTSPSDQS